MNLYKWTALDGSSCNGGTGKWSLPKHQGDDTWTPGRWRRRINDIEPCERGYHLCAEQVLPLFERARPDDVRPRQAIAVARAYAAGAATRAELDAAGAAAWDAAGAAARAAAGAAAWAAAWAAARDAAWAAAGAAARAAAGAAALAWQRQRLMEYITGAVS